MRVKKESKKNWLKLNIQKSKNMASGPVTSQQIGGEKVETVTDFSSRALKSLWVVSAALKLEDGCFLEGKLWQI